MRILEMLTTCRALDDALNSLGRKSSFYLKQAERLKREMRAFQYREEHAFELPPHLGIFDRGIPLDPKTGQMREGLLEGFRIKPLTPAEVISE